MKLFAAIGAILLISQMWAENKPPPPPPPFDADLFHHDEQIFSAHAEFLFWRVQEGALEYAQKSHSGWGPAECYAEGNYKKTTFNGDPGFRVALVYFRAPHYWESWMQYTRLTSTGNSGAGKPSSTGKFLTGTWPQIFTNPMAKAESHIHMNYNLGDLLVTRVFFPNPHLRLRTIGGGSVAWMDQFWKIVYRDGTSFETKIANSWRFIGGGLRIGTMADWFWTTDIYMTAGATFAGLLGSYHNKSKQTTNFQPSAAYNTAQPVRDAHYSDVRPAFEAQFFLGPSYQKNIDKYRFEFFVGFELTAWMNLQEIYHSTSGSPSDPKEPWVNTSMIALQGLTVRAILDF